MTGRRREAGALHRVRAVRLGVSRRAEAGGEARGPRAAKDMGRLYGRMYRERFGALAWPPAVGRRLIGAKS